MNGPKVSVVVTAYNRPDYLQAALNSVLAQTYRNHEIIVVDDASAVDLTAVVEACPVPMTYVRQSENGGPSRARNRGVALADGEYVAFLDDDDQWLPTKVAAQVEAMQGHRACLCGFTFLERNRPRVHAITEITGDSLRHGNIFCGASGLMARKDALSACPFDAGLSSGEEWDVYVRLSRRGPLAYVPEPLFLYRLGSHQGITTRARTMRIADIGVRVEHIHKNRAWLGEASYKILLARKILEYISSKNNKIGFLCYAIRTAGFFATLSVLIEKARRSQEQLSG